jgi:hypothetical protein
MRRRRRRRRRSRGTPSSARATSSAPARGRLRLNTTRKAAAAVIALAATPPRRAAFAPHSCERLAATSPSRVLDVTNGMPCSTLHRAGEHCCAGGWSPTCAVRVLLELGGAELHLCVQRLLHLPRSIQRSHVTVA